MTEYVAGFMFDNAGQRVALIEKQRPDWQKGKLNGIGGHIEPNETPDQAMVREFEEETGVHHTYWKKFAVLLGSDFKVHFFSAFNHLAFSNALSVTDEAVSQHDVDRLPYEPTITNIPWLIRMALSMRHERASSFMVEEVYV